MSCSVVLASCDQVESHLDGLADILIDCVGNGASVSFMLPLTRETAVGFWRNVAAGVRHDKVIPFLAFMDSDLAGVVLLRPSKLPNQPHVAEVSKLLVPSGFRRKGIARLLMSRLETEALSQKRSLLVLDTIKYGIAEAFYYQLGYKLAGTIPNFALMPDGKKAESVFLYKQL